MNGEVTVNIPKLWLLHIATYGDMGSGELGEFLKNWAVKTAIENGLSEELETERKTKLKQLGVNLSNILGMDMVRDIQNSVDDAMDNLQKRRKAREEK